VKQALQWMLSGYKRWLSPLLPNACRFVPTCSEYAMEAVERHGALRGSLLTGWRLLRCHPLARAGCDPVPQSYSWHHHVGGLCAPQDHRPLPGEAKRS
jgi:putative membrane protein insertion efficiency factor